MATGQDARPCKACGKPTKSFTGYCRRRPENNPSDDACRKGYRAAYYEACGRTGMSYIGTASKAGV